MNKTKEYGGGHWISKKEIDNAYKYQTFPKNVFIDTEEIHLSTCRSCLYLIAQNLKKHCKSILIPTYTCDTVINPFLENGYNIIPYNITYEFLIDWNDVCEKIAKKKPDIFLFHSYFGFPTSYDNPQFLHHIKDLGIKIIEDYTQNILSSFNRFNCDYKVGSIRKWFAIPDGGILNGLEIAPEFLDKEDVELVNRKLKAFSLKHEYLQGENNDKPSFLKQLSKAELLLSERKQIYRMSDISELIIFNSDLDQIRNQRRLNYIQLYYRLLKHSELSIPLKIEDQKIVPYMLPVFIQGRDSFQSFLAKKNIYATKLWNLPPLYRNRIDPNLEKYYQQVLCFPINEKYNENDMNYIGDVVDLYFNKTKVKNNT